MPTYRVLIDGIYTGNYVVANTSVDAYFEVASNLPLAYSNEVVVEEVDGIGELGGVEGIDSSSLEDRS